MNGWRWLVLCALGAALGAGWAAWHGQAPAAAPVGGATNLSIDRLPKPQTAVAGAQLAALPDAIRMWDGFRNLPASAPVQAAPPALWRVVGTTSQGTSTHVLILFQGSNAPRAIPVGGQLPGGAVVTGVGERDIQVSLDKRTYYLPIRPQP